MLPSLLSIVATLPVQWLAGFGFASLLLAREASRRPRNRLGLLRRARGFRALRPAAFALPLTLILVALAWLGLLPRFPAESLSSLAPGLIALAGIPIACGGWLLLVAGRDEARGRWLRARLLTRSGGLSLFLGSAAELVLLGLGVIVGGPATREALTTISPIEIQGIVAAVICMGSASFAGLLAGLTCKPRPTGGFAVGLWLAGRLLLATLVGR